VYRLDRVLVTGGAGFIGAEVVRQLLAAGASRVVTLDKLTYAADPGRLPDDPRHRLVVGDVCDGEAAVDLVRREGLRAVIHLAAESHVDRSIAGPDPFVMTNVVGTHRLLEAARAAWANAQDVRFVQVSTDEVYGELASDAPGAVEGDAYRPSSPYAASKAAADHFVRAAFRTWGLPVVITHGSNTYGPEQYPEKLIPVVVRAAKRGEPIPMYGDGLQVRDWLHVSDHAAGILAAATLGAPGASYNLGGGEERTNVDLIAAICEVLDGLEPGRAPHARLVRRVTDRLGHDRRYALSSERAAADLGWRPRVRLAEGLAAVVREMVMRGG
jgi:dTDP-glucose 4,6-dehydratase